MNSDIEANGNNYNIGPRHVFLIVIPATAVPWIRPSRSCSPCTAESTASVWKIGRRFEPSSFLLCFVSFRFGVLVLSIRSFTGCVCGIRMCYRSFATCPDSAPSSGQVAPPYTGSLDIEDVDLLINYIIDQFEFPELFVQPDGTLGCLGS